MLSAWNTPALPVRVRSAPEMTSIGVGLSVTVRAWPRDPVTTIAGPGASSAAAVLACGAALACIAKGRAVMPRLATSTARLLCAWALSDRAMTLLFDSVIFSPDPAISRCNATSGAILPLTDWACRPAT